jgi:hypothetical protein
MQTINSIPDEKFKPQEVMKGAPVEHEEALDNIRSSTKFDFPLFRKKKPNGGNLLFIAAGPSLRQFLPEIKRRHDAGETLITCNHTYDYLQEHGIVCDMCLLIDPRPENWDCVKKANPKTTFYVGTVVTPKLFEYLKEQGADVQKLLVAYGMEDQRDLKLQKELYDGPTGDYLVGGTMTPLRAMPFAAMLGMASMEFYGFDSCFLGNEPAVFKSDPRFDEILKRTGASYKDIETKEEYVIDEPEDGGFFYAFKKPRPENIDVVVTSDGSRYLTTPGLANQARQICKWVDRMEGVLEVKIHGDSLSSNLLKIHKDNEAVARAKIGDRRWTDEYAQMQRQLHEQGGYGLWGDCDMELISRFICTIYFNANKPKVDETGVSREGRILTALDYGAGSGALSMTIEKMFRGVTVTNYDPFHPKWRDAGDPGLHDVTLCTDVLEHVEQECVDNVLRYISDRTRYAALFVIALLDAAKVLPDGRNAHITQKPAKWWVERLTRYGFVPVEGHTNDETLVLICQKQDAKEQMAA